MKQRIYGDFQTPLPLARKIVQLLPAMGITWGRVLEPTCGLGHFLLAVAEVSPSSEMIGIEINPVYAALAQQKLPHASIQQGDIFQIDLCHALNWQTKAPLLVIGNPPWVTNTSMSVLEGENLPVKSNFRQMRGIEAITGSANFDLTEAIWIKILRDLTTEPLTVVFLCKTSVARKILQYAYHEKLPVSDSALRRVNAKAWFGVDVDAGLLVLRLSPNDKGRYQTPVYNDLDNLKPDQVMGFVGNRFVSDIIGYQKAKLPSEVPDSQFVWRAGVKHDATDVMELKQQEDIWINGLDEPVKVESEFVYPLVKSSDIQFLPAILPNRQVLIPQKHPDQKMQLAHHAPLLWEYLSDHQGQLRSRKSSIYRGKPFYSIFGIGEYSFAPYKVLISGFYKNPYFAPVGLVAGKPLLCDDTCYLLPCESAIEAALLAALLNHPIVQTYINSIVFWDNKRPITKKLLDQIPFTALLRQFSCEMLVTAVENSFNQAHHLGAPPKSRFEIQVTYDRLLAKTQLEKPKTLPLWKG